MSQVLVDSSIWIEFLKVRTSARSMRLRELVEQNRVCTIPMVIAEVVSGARDEEEYQMLWEDMNELPKVSEPEGIWEMLTKTRFELQRRNRPSFGLVDLYIAHAAYLTKKILFTADHHFGDIAKLIPLDFLQ